MGSAQGDLYVELLNEKARMRLLHVPYKGGAPATTDAIGGQITTVFSLLPVLLPRVQGGKLKPIAVTSGKRQSALPEVATFTELGIDLRHQCLVRVDGACRNAQGGPQTGWLA